jgi:serpin B
MTSEFSLASVLASMGMTDAFNPRAADFSGITGSRDLFISAVLHKAFVEVNEEGTEAAAATGVAMKLTSIGPQRTPVFRADHPFLFLIRDNHLGSILFLGRVMDPSR